ASFIWHPMCHRCTRGGRPRIGTIGCRRERCASAIGMKPRAAGLSAATIARKPIRSAHLDDEADTGALLAVDRDVDERRDAHEIEATRGDVAARDRDR